MEKANQSQLLHIERTEEANTSGQHLHQPNLLEREFCCTCSSQTKSLLVDFTSWLLVTCPALYVLAFAYTVFEDWSKTSEANCIENHWCCSADSAVWRSLGSNISRPFKRSAGKLGIPFAWHSFNALRIALPFITKGCGRNPRRLGFLQGGFPIRTM